MAIAMTLAQAVVQVLSDRIFLLLETEGKLVIGARREFKAIGDELESMKSFLRDADRKSVMDQEVETWVGQVRDAAYNVEDIIDEFLYRVDEQFSKGKLTGYVNQFVKFPKNSWVKHKMASRLEKIKADIKEINERHQRYKFHREEEQGVRFQRQGDSPLSAENDVVGMKGYENTLLDWLLSGERQELIYSVLGMGGSGKTTIVAKVYNNKAVKRYFQCSAWITLSQVFVVENLLKSMIKEFCKEERDLFPIDLDKMEYNQLVVTIQEYLQQKRYVIVLDDVWNLNFDLWRRIKAAILPTSNASAIMLTTRNEEIAKFSFEVPSCILRIERLPDGKAWELFCRRAFLSDPNRHCPELLEPTAQALVKRCEGLPLTIVVLGNLMSSKDKTELEWKKVCQNPNWEVSNNPKLGWVKSILLLSFHDLPYHLKHCFKYCCVFPEDYLIKRKRLIRLWIAEGFVQKIEGKTLEEVAETYLNELVCRSMLEVVTKNHLGRAKRVRLHDLMRELGLSISKGEKFCVLYNRGDGEGEEVANARGLSMHRCDKDIPPSFDMSKLRSFTVFPTEATLLSRPYELQKKFKFLRVLDLEGVPITILPDEIGELFSLRYLNLRETHIKEVPKALGKLRNLQTLDVCDTKVEALPTSVMHLQNLRNLLMYCYDLRRSESFHFVRGMRVPFEISKLQSLQVLAFIEADNDMVRQLGDMTQLRRIGITMVSDIQVPVLCAGIQKLELLRSLFLKASKEDEALPMDYLKCPPRLQRLTLVGKLNSVPSWFGSLDDLTFLFLKYSKLREDPLSKIHALHNLRHLTLSNAYEGKRLNFRTMWFRMLKKLRLWNLSQLNEVTIEKGAMPDIEELWVSGCKKLLMLPQGIEYLSKLKELTLDYMPEQFVNRLREGSIDHPRIAHIPQINHYYRISGKMHHESLS